MIIKSFGPQSQAKVITAADARKPYPVLHYEVDYDTTHPENTIKSFVASVKSMVAKYECNRERIGQIEAQLNDLKHYVEIGKNKAVPGGYGLYRKQAELLRERRQCKYENDLLQPVWDHFHATEVLPKLAMVQGECTKIKTAIDNRVYTARTDVLDEYIYTED